MTTAAERYEMRHRVDTWLSVMPDQLVPIPFPAHTTTKTITPQYIIQQAVKVFTGMTFPSFATGAQDAAQRFTTATAK